MVTTSVTPYHPLARTLHWALALLIVLLLFGGAKLPSLAKGLGQSIKEFKKAAKEGDEDDKSEKKPDANQKPGNN